MRQVRDLRVYKKKLREFFKDKRNAMSAIEKAQKDTAILEKVIKLHKFKECNTILTYVSTPIEVDTRELIDYCFKNGKKVAVPYCVPGTRNMEFYYINSFNDLSKGNFSVDEPNPLVNEKIVDFTDSICFVPGLCFDKKGYRLGYGMGYYDRFLSDYNQITIGLCYYDCIKNILENGKFDRRSDIVVTDKSVIRTYL